MRKDHTGQQIRIEIGKRDVKPPIAAVQSWGQVAVAAAAMLGLAWAAMPAFLMASPTAENRLSAVAMIFAAAGIGAVALGRKPRAATWFCTVLTAAAALIALSAGSHTGSALGGFALLYGAALVLVTRHNHRIVEANANALREIAKQNEIISLALNDFAEDAGGWLWETDELGRLTYASRGLAHGLGRPASDLMGKSFASLFAAEAAGAGWDRLLLTMAAGQSIECTAELAFGNDRKWWQIACHPVIGSDGALAGHRGVAHNITAERHARRKLAEEKDLALRDNASKSHFLSLLSHELRTPLNAIVGYTELLLSAPSDNLSEAQRREYLETMRDSSLHLKSLIAGVLDVSRIEKGKLQIVDQDIDAAEIAEVAVKMCRDAAEQSDITIIAEVVEGIELRCDATRIKQVLINLVTNAIKFSNPGATVRLEFEAPGDGSLIFAIHDRGIGIAAPDLALIFEPFVQADDGSARRFGGMGLGLPIARRIAILHGGDVTITSAEGIGTTVRLVLPPSRVKWPAPEAAETICAA
jgi:signal transduction histidine kinase